MSYLKIESAEAISSPQLKKFYAYWLSRCEDDAVPRWSDIDLMEIYSLAPYIAVKDVIDGGAEFRNRYWGTELTNAYVFDATGKTFSDYLKPDAVEEGLAFHRQILADRQPRKSSGTLAFWKSRIHIAFSGIICPLRGSGEEIGHIISCYEISMKK